MKRSASSVKTITYTSGRTVRSVFGFFGNSRGVLLVHDAGSRYRRGFVQMILSDRNAATLFAFLPLLVKRLSALTKGRRGQTGHLDSHGWRAALRKEGNP